MSIMQITQTVQIMPPLQYKQARRSTQPMLPGMEPEPEAAPQITNRQIAEVLAGVADMIEAQNGNPYRIQAYRNAARGILDLQEPAAAILERGEPLPIPGLGQRLRTRIAELIYIGSMTINNGLYMQALPAGVRALLALEFIGPYTAIRLYEELGIDSVEKLQQEAQLHHIRKLPGFGALSEARLQRSAESALQKSRRGSPSLGGAA